MEDRQPHQSGGHRRKFSLSPRLRKLTDEFEARGGEWKDYALSSIFTARNGNFDIQQTHLNDKGVYVVSSGEQNQGVIGKTDIEATIFPANTITVDMFGNVFHRDFAYKMVTHARVFSLAFRDARFTDKCALHVTTLMGHFKEKFSYSNMASWNKVRELFIPLPTLNGQIAFDFMEAYTCELEAERMCELDKYLAASGLNVTTLTQAEERALQTFRADEIEWKEYQIGKVFEKLEVSPLPFEIREKHAVVGADKTHTLPLTNAKYGDNGIMYYGEKDFFKHYSNVIAVVYDGAIAAGSVYAYEDAVGVYSHSYLIRKKSCDSDFLDNLFYKTVIEKVLYPKYTRDNAAHWNKKVESDIIQLPIRNGKIDFAFMRDFISAQEKLALRGVLAWKDQMLPRAKSGAASPHSV